MTTSRDDCIILGRKIGTFSGWNVQDTLVVIFYEFEPVEGLQLPTEDLTVDFDGGQFITDKDGKIDIVDLIKGLPRCE